MRVIGIDPGRNTGYAVAYIFDNNDIMIENKGVFKDTGKEFNKRFKELYNKIDELIYTIEPDFIVLEKGFVGRNKKTSLRLGELRGMIKTLSLKHDIDYFGFEPTEIKKCVTGNGKAKKVDVQKAINKQFNTDIECEDISDAVALVLTFVENIEKG